MFSPYIVERAKLTSGEQETSSHHEAPLQDEKQFHLDTDMEDFEVHEEKKIVDLIIMEKEAEIRELKDSFSKENFLLSFLQ